MLDFSAEHRMQRILLLLVVVMLCMACFLDSFLPIPALDNEPTTEWEGPWTIYEGETAIAKDVKLPYSIEGPLLGKTFTAAYRLPASFPNHNTAIAVNTSMSSLIVSVDGTSIYRFEGPKQGWARPVFGGSTPHFIRLDDAYQGKTLSLTFEYTSNNAFAGYIHEVRAGSKASLILTEFKEWPSLFFGFSLLLLGTLIALFSFAIQTKEEQKSFFYLAMILLALGGWVFSQTPSKFLLWRNPVLPMNFSFAALYTLPTFLTNYVIHSYPVHRRIKHFKRISLLFLLMYIIGGLLQMTGIAQYTDLLLYSGLALALFLIALFTNLGCEYIKGNSRLSSFLLAFSCLLASILAEVVLLAMNIQLDSAVLLHFGMALSAVILFWHSIALVRQKTQQLSKEQLLQQIAYTDALTGVGNRASYDMEVERICNAGKLEVLGILMMDVNNLKQINDTQGHKAGDNVLRDFGQRLSRLLPASATLYRYGGDEFIALIPKVDEDQIAKLADTVLDFFSSSGKVDYDVAVGYAVYIPKKKEKFAQVVSRADAAMYRCKSAMKAKKV